MFLTLEEVRRSIFDIVSRCESQGQTDSIRDAFQIFFSVYRSDLPLYPESQYFELPLDLPETGHTHTPPAEYLVIEVPINKLYGESWLFQNNRSEGRPLPARIANILMYLLSGQTLLPVAVIKYGDKYIVDDGNHRIYSGFIMGLETIPCRVFKEISL